MSLAVGNQLGPYQLIEEIGAGGMGEVWKARDTRLDRIVAIKRLKETHNLRFQQEARAIAALNHPHICTLHDVGPDYLVMEFIEGQPLRGPMPFTEVLATALQITSALRAAHAKGILHRDIKPANILVSANGAKLLDFGLAKVTSEIDATTMAGAGTPLYMSPEQAEGKPIDVRSDIFSFGAVLYEMVAGRRAFNTLGSVLRDSPAPLDAAPELTSIVTRCLAKAPADRFPDMAALAEALERCRSKVADAQPSIAVLPFANMSGDKENEYFSDGLAEEILNSLAQIEGLKVIARTSSFAFRGKEQDIVEIAQRLRVRTILEGSVRRSGNRIRVTAQLIEANEGTHLWSDRYDRDLEDVFKVQDEIASSIAASLRVRLIGRTGKSYRPNLPAYEALLKGRYYLQQNTPEGHLAAKVALEHAIALDPLYAPPHAELAVFYLVTAAWGMGPAAQVLPIAREHARKAFELDPDEPQAHTMLGAISIAYDRDRKTAADHFRKAMASGTLPPEAHVRCAIMYLLPVGRIQEGLAELHKALEKDPLSFLWRSLLGMALANLGQYENALEELRKSLELNSNGWLAYQWMSVSYAATGRLAEARRAAERAMSLAPWNTVVPAVLAAIMRLSGETPPAELFSRAGPNGKIFHHLLCSEVEAAADAFEEALHEHDVLVVLMNPNSNALLKPLRESSRWPAIAKLLNLSEALET